MIIPPCTIYCIIHYQILQYFKSIILTQKNKARQRLQVYLALIQLSNFRGTSVRNKRENQPPASLGQNYFREER